MSSGTELIQEALQQIGAFSLAAPDNPESIELGKNKLNSLIQVWLSDCIDMGATPIDAAGDEVSEPLDARNAIVDNLSVMLAPSFDNGPTGKPVVSQVLAANARAGYGRVKAIYWTGSIPLKVVSSTLPLGAGNRSRFGGGFFSRNFKPKGGTIGG